MIIAAWILLVCLGVWIPEILHEREERRKKRENDKKLKKLKSND